MPEPNDTTRRRRDDAARAAWLYFIAGRTQDDIAHQLNVSRQAAQRLVSQAVAERLVSFRVDHPIASCTALAERLIDRYGLDFCEVVPTDLVEPGSTKAIAVAAALRLNRILGSKTPVILGVGTGRTMRACVHHLQEVDRPQHKILSLVGNMATDGRASIYEVAMRMADRVGAQRFPLAVPVLAASPDERAVLQGLASYRGVRELFATLNVVFVGISEIAWQCPLHRDGFAREQDIADLLSHGAVGEMVGWSFDAHGRILEGTTNRKVTSLPLSSPPAHLTVIVGGSPEKVEPIRAALRGRLGNALITDERTAATVLEEAPAALESVD